MRLINATVLGLALFSGAALAKDVYLYDVMKRNPSYQTTWRSMAKTGPALPWMKIVNGPTVPLHTEMIEGRPYQVGWICEAHNCGNTFYFALSPKHAYGLHWDGNQENPAPEFYGRPSKGMKAFLQKYQQKSMQ